jgi:hypothetical protein
MHHALHLRQRWPVPICSGHEQENVLAEATMIIPDTQQRLETAYQELQALLVSAQVHVYGCTPLLRAMPNDT